jgi:hypothetical protein
MSKEKEELLESTKKKCTNCGSTSILPISYGLISDEAHEENAKDRKWVWGGCVIKAGGNTDHCNDCGKSFGGDSYEEEPFDEEAFLLDREKLFNTIDKFLDEERDEDLYAQALKEAEGDEVEAEHIYFSLFIDLYSDNK